MTWRRLSLDAKVVGVLALSNWALLFQKHTIVMVTRDEPMWLLFPGLFGPLYLFIVGVVALAYPLRDLRDGAAFTRRARWVHLGTLIFLFVVLPMVAAMVLRATGKPYTYIHDGALMAEEAAKKLLAGRDPYGAQYLDTPLFYWPMINNPALYHFTYFPLLFLITAPPLLLLYPRLGWFDERLLFLPAFLGCVAVAALLVRASAPRSPVRPDVTSRAARAAPGGPHFRRGSGSAEATPARLALVGAIALNPQLFPFVVEGRNDAFVLLFVLLTVLFLQRQRPALAGLSLAVAVGTKLHAAVLAPFVFVYLVARARPRGLRQLWRAVAPAGLAFAAVSAAVFLPFLIWDIGSFYDDIVAYNVGASAWSYPIAGIGFSVLLHALGVIPYRSAEFPFWIFELAAAVPVAVITLRRLWRAPRVSTLLVGYAATLLAFLFFGRYFQTSYLGYIVAAATPALFLPRAPGPRPAVRPVPAPAPAAATGGK